MELSAVTPCTPDVGVEIAGLLVRDLRSCDREAFEDMFQRLSPQSRLRRYLAPKLRLTNKELRALTDVDHVRHSAIAAVDGADRFLGVARYAAYPGDDAVADVAIEVVDDWQRGGIGTLLGARIVERACRNGLTLLRATTLWENVPARALLRRLGFRVAPGGDGLIEFALELPLRAASRTNGPRMARR